MLDEVLGIGLGMLFEILELEYLVQENGTTVESRVFEGQMCGGSICIMTLW